MQTIVTREGGDLATWPDMRTHVGSAGWAPAAWVVEMGRRLLSAGCDLAVFNRSMGKAEPLIRLGAKPAGIRRGTGDQGYRLHHRRLVG